MSDLDDRLRAAHAARDAVALARAYTVAADTAPDTEAACFFLTHAFVFALEAGDPAAPALHARLAAHGRV